MDFKSLKKKLPELRDAVDGYITPEQAGKLKVIKAHYESLESRKAELEKLILALAALYQQELAILQTAPGISSIFTAIGIISEMKGYQPTYTRTELTDALHEAFGFCTCKEIVPVKKMKKICADTKRQRK